MKYEVWKSCETGYDYKDTSFQTEEEADEYVRSMERHSPGWHWRVVPVYMVYVYGAYLRKRYGGHLVEIKVIAQSRSEARKIVRGMIENSPHIDIDEGLLLNDEYEYR